MDICLQETLVRNTMTHIYLRNQKQGDIQSCPKMTHLASAASHLSAPSLFESLASSAFPIKSPLVTNSYSLSGTLLQNQEAKPPGPPPPPQHDPHTPAIRTKQSGCHGNQRFVSAQHTALFSVLLVLFWRWGQPWRGGEGWGDSQRGHALQTLLTFPLSKSPPRVGEGFFASETIDLKARSLLMRRRRPLRGGNARHVSHMSFGIPSMGRCWGARRFSHPPPTARQLTAEAMKSTAYI